MTQRKQKNYDCGADLCKDLCQAVVAYLKVLTKCLLTKMMRNLSHNTKLKCEAGPT